VSEAVVVAAAIVRGGPAQVLAAQRRAPAPLAGLWELPGGKVEPGESEREALVRECREELGVTVAVGERAAPDVAVVGGGAVLRTYWARVVDGEPAPLDHAALRWLSADELDDVVWLPSDGPVVDAVRRGITSTS
jgi:8-oxo-dGTP diphosphatase